MLGFVYDVRHAAQGDRELFNEPNGVQEWYTEAFGTALPAHNVRYACNVLYPEALLINMALNDPVKHRMLRLAKTRYGFEAPLDKAVINDFAIAVIRLFQSAFVEAVGEVLSKSSFTRWRNIVHDRITDVIGITHPFVDTWNLRYLEMNRDIRAKKLVAITKRFAGYQYDSENLEYRRAIDRAIEENGWDENSMRFDGMDYPEEIIW